MPLVSTKAHFFVNALRIVITKYSSHLTFGKVFYFFIEIS